MALGFCLAAVCRAESRLLVMASGNCQDFNLLESGKLLSAALEERLGEEVIDQAEVINKFGAPASRSAEEIQAQLDSARVHYYSSEYEKARSKVEDALREIKTLPVGPTRWALLVNAELLHGLVLRQNAEQDAANGAFAHVLRLAPNFQLDPDYYAPSTCTDFDKVRHQLRTVPKIHFQVRSNPSGAEVFLDGLKVGVTPFAGEYSPGTYDVVVAKGGMVSRVHSFRLEKPDALHIDLDFEGLLSPRELFCLLEGIGEQGWIRGAVKVATLLGSEEVVVARLQRPPSGPSWFTASLVSTLSGGKIREAGFKVEGLAPAPQSFDKLADFIVTGKAEGAIVVADTAKASPPPWVPPAAPVAVTPLRSPASSWRIASYASFGVSGASLGSAVVLLLLNRGDLDRLKSYQLPDGTLLNNPEARGLVQAIHARRSAATGLFVASGLAAASGLTFYFLARKKEDSGLDVSAAVHHAGWMVFVRQSF